MSGLLTYYCGHLTDLNVYCTYPDKTAFVSSLVRVRPLRGCQKTWFTYHDRTPHKEYFVPVYYLENPML